MIKVGEQKYIERIQGNLRPSHVTEDFGNFNAFP